MRPANLCWYLLACVCADLVQPSVSLCRTIKAHCSVYPTPELVRFLLSNPTTVLVMEQRAENNPTMLRALEYFTLAYASDCEANGELPNIRSTCVVENQPKRTLFLLFVLVFLRFCFQLCCV